MFRRVLYFFCFLAALLSVKRFCYKQTGGFALHKIRSTLSFQKEWQVPPLETEEREELFKRLDQPYRYLARGAQSYVFVSEDGATVIKFFRLNHLRPPFWLTLFPFPPFLQKFQAGKVLAKRKELEKDFSSYLIAYNTLKEETGLLCLHLNKTNDLQKKVVVHDRLNIAHVLDLDQMEFVVQKRAELVYPHVEKVAALQGLESAKEAISSLVQLLKVRSSKGIFDKDPDLNTNFGFLEKTPVQIDIGRFSFREEKVEGQEARDELIRITDNFRQWLDQRFPELSLHLMQEIEGVGR